MILEDLTQVSVMSAVGLFIAKEVIEHVKKSGATKRKRAAIVSLLINECEKNNFTFKSLSSATNEIEGALLEGDTFDHDTIYGGTDFLKVIRADRMDTQIPVPDFHSDNLDKYLFDVAEISPKLFELMIAAKQALVEAKHVRHGFFVYPVSDTQHLSGFLPWAKSELDELIEPVRALYLYIANEPLTASKVR